MAKPQTFWMRGPDGAYAFVSGADERDRWIPRGHVVADEPQPGSGTFVWLEHGEHHGRAKFPIDVVAEDVAQGWHPSPPAEPVDLTRDPAPIETPAPAAGETTEPAAASGDKKE